MAEAPCCPDCGTFFPGADPNAKKRTERGHKSPPPAVSRFAARLSCLANAKDPPPTTAHTLPTPPPRCEQGSAYLYLSVFRCVRRVREFYYALSGRTASTSSSRRTMCLHPPRVRPAHHIHTTPRALPAGKVSNASARSGKVVFEEAVLWCVAMTARPPTLLSGRPDTTSHPAHTARAHRLTPRLHHHRRFYDFNHAGSQTPPPKATACTRARSLPPCILPHAPSSPPRHITANPKCRPILHAA